MRFVLTTRILDGSGQVIAEQSAPFHVRTPADLLRQAELDLSAAAEAEARAAERIAEALGDITPA